LLRRYAPRNDSVFAASMEGAIAMPCPRLLPFDAAPFSRSPIAGAVPFGSRVFLGGRNALQPDGSVVGLGDAAAQAPQRSTA
jgi:hypothetical protein